MKERRTDSRYSRLASMVVLAMAMTALGVAAESLPPRIVFLGDSLTAGYGVGADRAYPAHLAARIREAGWSFEVVNAGVSGETSAGGLRRVDWLLRQPIDVLVLELGANDALRGTAVNATEENLQSIIDRVQEADADIEIVIVGMLAPPNLGAEYTSAFRKIFPRLSERNDLPLVPFLLEGVAGEAELNQSDGIHPTAAGHEILAENVWPVLEEVLEARVGERGALGSDP